MNRSDFYSNFNIYLDLAVEAHDLVRGETGREIPGVIEKIENFPNAKITTITITNELGEKQLGRRQGNYITIDAPEVRENNYVIQNEIAEVLAQKMSQLFNLDAEANILVIGLGNRNATPDALGPKVVQKVMVSRHLFHYIPQEIEGKMRKVSAISPGVLGLTGIETAEIIEGLVEHVKPDCVIAIDALAAGAVERIGTSIQLADTGINPGAGVGNKRKVLNEETLGCKVFAIGVPTVVNAAVIAHKVIEELFEQLESEPKFANMYNESNEKILTGIIEKTLSPFRENLMVTPKEVDDMIDRTSRVIANALNIGLHPGVNSQNYETYLQYQ